MGRIAGPSFPPVTQVSADPHPAAHPAPLLPLHDRMLTLSDIGFESPTRLLAGYGLQLVRVADGEPIPGSYWGECEAGLIGETVYARADTPVHSLLHEAGHLIVLPPEHRADVHTDATDSIEEEDAVCVLQALLGDALPGVGRARILADMDAWGYTFRLGSAQAYFDHDADSAWQWLADRGLVDLGQRSLKLPTPQPRSVLTPGPASGLDSHTHTSAAAAD
jgi:hypothetical protein